MWSQGPGTRVQCLGSSFLKKEAGCRKRHSLSRSAELASNYEQFSGKIVGYLLSRGTKDEYTDDTAHTAQKSFVACKDAIATCTFTQLRPFKATLSMLPTGISCTSARILTHTRRSATYVRSVELRAFVLSV